MEKQTFTFPSHDTYKDVFAIVKTLNGTYVCPGWHQVPEGTTRDQIIIDTSVTVVKEPVAPELPKTPQPQSWTVSGSKPGSKYTVTFNGSIWLCDCPASQFRRGECKHVKNQREEVEKSLA